MCPWKRISIVLLAGCLITTNQGMAEAGSLERQKRLAVESALGAEAVAGADAILAAALDAHAIEGVAYDSASSELTVRVNGKPDVDWVFIEHTNRLAIDIHDAVNLVAGRPVEVTPGSTVESIRTSLFKLEPQIISRIVLQMTGPVDVELNDAEPGALVFTFAGGVPTPVVEEEPVEEEPVAMTADSIIESIEAELNAQLARADAERERIAGVFSETKEQIAERHDALLEEADSKEYPTQLGYMVVLADHESLLNGHMGEIDGEAQVISDRVEMARAEMHTIMKSDYEEAARVDELHVLLTSAQEAGALDAGRFDQIHQIALDEQSVAISAIDSLAQKVADSASIVEEIEMEEPIQVAAADAEMPIEVNAELETPVEAPVESETPVEATFEVTDADPAEDMLVRIDDLMEEALADETADEPVMEASEIVVGEAEVTTAEDTLAALDDLASEMSRLRSHPSAEENGDESLPLIAMLPPESAFAPETDDSAAEPMAEVELAPVEIEAAEAVVVLDAAAGNESDATSDTKSLIASQESGESGESGDSDVEVRPDTDAPAADATTPSAVGGPEVTGGVAAEVADGEAFESIADPAERTAVPVEDARTATNDPGVAAARAAADTSVRSAPQVMAQANAGQPEVITSDSLGAPPAPPRYDGDPMDQPVSIEFRDELLRNIIGLLAQKAGVNIIGGGTLGDVTVSANMRDVPLRQAMNMLLRLEDFGMVEEEGVLRIVPYDVAVQLRRVTRMVPLSNAHADEVEKTLLAVTAGATVDQQVLVASNATANVVVLSGPMDRVEELEQLVLNLDIAEPKLPTVTEAIRLNYADPDEVKTIVETLLTVDGEQDIGKVESDVRGRSVVVTDLPIVVEQVRALIQEIDYPVKQVNIDSMVVDVTLTDVAATGVDWFVNLLRRTNTNGELVGNLSNAQFASDFGAGGALPGPIPAPGQVLFPLGGNQNPIAPFGAGVLQFGILSSDFDIQGLISAEVNNNNAEILANPKLVTLENQPAQIEIIQEFPYRELTQTEGGGQIASTEFKNIGTTLEVTPRVTATEDILVNIFVEQSAIVGFSEGDNVPITNNRRATTNVRTDDRQTIFIGGLRRVDDALDVRKVPVLGDLPVISPLFRTTRSDKQNTDLLIFVTCDVLGESAPNLTGTQQQEYDRLGGKPDVPNSQREVLRTWAKPNEMRDPIWKWRRSK